MPGHNNGNERQDTIDAVALENDLAGGLRFAHALLDVTRYRTNASLALVQAMAKVLVANGVIQDEELKKSLAEWDKIVAEREAPRVRVYDVGDKYAEGESMDVDCLAIHPICQARCCTFKFWLTKQDLDEGIARWDYGNPYWIKQEADGFCTHFDRETRGCTIHAQRPHICRRYDCRNDKRIWLDFEKRILAPFEPSSGNADVAMEEVENREAIQNAQAQAARSEGTQSRIAFQIPRYDQVNDDDDRE